ncbi:MAG: hypothetical protein HQL40_19925, partial [Alphaproteobacteria bacterium]|nr:hypothetical protein [Alphaproteobacteria bacterium]
ATGSGAIVIERHIETLSGSTAVAQAVSLGTTFTAGVQLVLAGGIESLTGSTAWSEQITLAGTGNSTTLTSIETLTGGTGTDVVTLADTGSHTITITGGVETLTGTTSGTSVVSLVGGQTIAIAQADVVSGPTLHLVGGTGTQVVNLAGNAGTGTG